MHLNCLCFVLPSEVDDHQLHPNESSRKIVKNRVKITSVPASSSSQRQCGANVFKYIRGSLHRFLDSEWFNFCQQKIEDKKFLFQDTEGVKLSTPEEVGSESPRIFSYSELYIGSNGFSEKEILGSGGFGKVYRAILPSDGTVVAVKCLTEKGEQFEKTFAAELVAVAHLRHRNLVRLRGWCVHDDQLLLVYDYMPNRSLDRVLFRRPENFGSAPLDWERRKRIVTGLGAALFYLHEQLETQIIHRDVKTSNVMLDSNFNARLGDFGLARWVEHKIEYQTRTPSMKNQQFRLEETTRIGGTIGYLPPESFQRRSVATAKSDVFSFGIVVLEIVSGRRAVDLTYPDDQIILLDWTRKLSDEGMLLQAGDDRLSDGSFKLSEMERMIQIALLCTLHDPKSRPNMKWVLDILSCNIYGKLPDLPSFKSQPLYISLSSSRNSSGNGGGSSSYTIITRSITTSISSSSISSSRAAAAAADSNFFTAAGETIYITAEYQGSSNSSRRCSNMFPVVETPRVITYKEIISATNNFSDSRRVAEVDFGTAYHGFLDNHYHVLVKRLGMKTCPALRVRFSNELQNLGRLRHRNLVQLRGWCTEQGEMLVVYDYSANRLLSHLLFHHRNSVLKWRYRYNIIKSIASAIRYLHEEWEEQVIHRSITSSAVILEPDMNPRLGSFALAEFLTRNEHGHHVVIDKKKSVCGIFGYMSPEYMESGEATTMADVYSFGVVILEMVTGQMAVDFRKPEVLLVKRVYEFNTQKRPLQQLADLRLDGDYNHGEFLRLISLGIACTSPYPESRPSMRQIVSILDGYDQWLTENQHKQEKMEGWRHRNVSSLSLIRRIQSLGIQ